MLLRCTSAGPRVGLLGRRALHGSRPPFDLRDDCYQLVFLRHGESRWNRDKRFSGWVDIDLTEKGRVEATQAGRLLKKMNFKFDEAHTSLLKRAVRTLWTALHSSNHHWIPVKHTWRLNERHYGGLTGLSKLEAERELGKDMLMKYRRGYDTVPPQMEASHPYWTGNDRRYRDLGSLLPRQESLKQCKERILPYWYESIVPSIRAGRRVLIAAHNNVIRCLVKHLDHIPRASLRDIEIPTGTPIVYYLDKDTLQPVGRPDHTGFRGEVIKSDGVQLCETEFEQHVIRPSEVLTLEMLNQEAERLGMDPRKITFSESFAAQQASTPSAPAHRTHSPVHRDSANGDSGAWRELALKQTGF